MIRRCAIAENSLPLYSWVEGTNVSISLQVHEKIKGPYSRIFSDMVKLESLEFHGFQLLAPSECAFTLRELQKYFGDHDVLPPRTGHAGDWASFLTYSGTPLDFNYLICTLGLGYPLMVGGTWTEGPHRDSGDIVYMPGSVLEKSQVSKLELLGAADGRWQKSDPNQSLYVPITLVRSNNQEQSLVEFHCSRFYEKYKNHLNTEADFLLKNEDMIKTLLVDLFRLAKNEKNSKRILSNVFGHILNKNGVSEPIKSIDIDDSKIHLNDFSLDHEQAIESVFAILRTQKNTDYLKNDFVKMKGPFPLLSMTFMILMEAILQTDRPQAPTRVSSPPSIVHFHWGARKMAGIPPFKKGYVFGDSAQRRMKTLFQAVQKCWTHVQDLTIIILPAPVFMILVPKRSPDAPLIRDFIQTFVHRPQEKEAALSKIKSQLSADFWKRLSSTSFYDLLDTSSASNEWEIPEEFYDISVSDLTEIIGDLFVYANEPRASGES